MTIYEQVDKMLNQDKERPLWADEILTELKEIKQLLKNSSKREKKYPKDKAYFKFVNDLRDKLRASIADNRYPEIIYNGRALGINFKGWIYDKSDSKVLPAHEAFKVYRFLYENKKDINNYLNL
jgi:hypothetical protein